MNAHWEEAYAAKPDNKLSWHQDRPEPSLNLILEGHDPASLGVIDIGAGRARLADELITAGCSDLTLVDFSSEALGAVKTRLSGSPTLPGFIQSSVTMWHPYRTWDVWHDRATFHFFTTEADRAAYKEALFAGTQSGSRVVIATFAENGPERCSGLPVRRYSASELAAELGDHFAISQSLQFTHNPPIGAPQNYLYAVFDRL